MKINIRNYFMLLLGLVAILFTACGNDTTDSDESMIQNSYTIDADGDFGEDVTVSKIKSLVCQAYSVQSIGNNIFLTGNAIACDAKIRDIANETVIDINNKFTEEVTGIRTQTLNQIKDVYDKFLLDLLLDNNTNELIEIVKHTLNTNDQVATDYVNQQRMTLLENIDKNRKK